MHQRVDLQGKADSANEIHTSKRSSRQTTRACARLDRTTTTYAQEFEINRNKPERVQWSSLHAQHGRAYLEPSTVVAPIQHDLFGDIQNGGTVYLSGNDNCRLPLSPRLATLTTKHEYDHKATGTLHNNSSFQEIECNSSQPTGIRIITYRQSENTMLSLNVVETSELVPTHHSER